MTAYNREKYIAEAIESVLSSTYKNFELIIVDDKSSDKTLDIAKSYENEDNRIKVYINENNLGDYPNRNTASTYANGKYIKYVDSDDMIFSNTLEIMVMEMEQRPNAGFGFSSRINTSTKSFSPIEAYRCHFFERGILDIGPTSIIYRREKFEEVGKFKSLRNVSDLDLNLRMAARFEVIELKKDLIYWREHPGQEIRLDPDKYLEYGLQIIQNIIDDPKCPLLDSEKKIVITKTKRIYANHILQSIIKKGNMKKYLSYWINNKLSIKDII
jgi:glycosyltransferase involved in cell wall biosynthesis